MSSTENEKAERLIDGAEFVFAFSVVLLGIVEALTGLSVDYPAIGLAIGVLSVLCLVLAVREKDSYGPKWAEIGLAGLSGLGTIVYFVVSLGGVVGDIALLVILLSGVGYGVINLLELTGVTQGHKKAAEADRRREYTAACVAAVERFSKECFMMRLEQGDWEFLRECIAENQERIAQVLGLAADEEDDAGGEEIALAG